MTIANAWFFMAAIGTDLLWLRFYLFAAYVSLLIAGLTNFPPWGTWHRINGDLWILGGILWPFIVGESHRPSGISFIRIGPIFFHDHPFEIGRCAHPASV